MSYKMVLLVVNLLLFSIPASDTGPFEGMQSPYKLSAQNHTLFYIERNKNANTVVYDANVTANGYLNPNEPLDVYYIHYASDGKRAGLNYIERMLAYGYESEKASREAFNIKLTAFRDRELKLTKKAGALPELTCVIAGVASHLTHIYVFAKPGLYTDVMYVELFGTSLANGQAVYEKIKVS